MAINPFEPPRSTALDAGPAVASEGRTLPEAALRELQATAGPSMWAARLAVVSLVVTLLNALITLVRATKPSETGAVLGSLVVTLPLSLFFLGLYRRYADHARRLTRGEPGALTGLIDTQRSIFKGYGILVIISISLVLAFITFGILAAVMGRR